MRKLKICDLHVHSNCSDGACSPEALLPIGKEAGISAVALCDHNTVVGLDRFEAAFAGSGILAVPGVEITAGYCEKEVHILGLFVPDEARPKLTEYLSEINRRKRECNRNLIQALRTAGYAITDADVAKEAGEAIPNRVHVAKALMKQGYLASVKEGFDTLLSDDGAFYRPAERLDALDVVAFLRSVSAVPVIAHPLLNLSEAELCAFLPQAKAHGLVGMETLYSMYTEAETALAAQLAERFDILPSGGSDFHGANRPEVQMGVGRGNLAIPLDHLEALRAFCK